MKILHPLPGLVPETLLAHVTLEKPLGWAFLWQELHFLKEPTNPFYLSQASTDAVDLAKASPNIVLVIFMVLFVFVVACLFLRKRAS